MIASRDGCVQLVKHIAHLPLIIDLARVTYRELGPSRTATDYRDRLAAKLLASLSPHIRVQLERAPVEARMTGRSAGWAASRDDDFVAVLCGAGGGGTCGAGGPGGAGLAVEEKATPGRSLPPDIVVEVVSGTPEENENKNRPPRDKARQADVTRLRTNMASRRKAGYPAPAIGLALSFAEEGWANPRAILLMHRDMATSIASTVDRQSWSQPLTPSLSPPSPIASHHDSASLICIPITVDVGPVPGEFQIVMARGIVL